MQSALNFFAARKIEVTITGLDTFACTRVYKVSLGPKTKVAQIEKVMREFGLYIGAVAIPQVSLDYTGSVVLITSVMRAMQSHELNVGLSSADFLNSPARIPLLFGVDYTGKNLIVDLSQLPHLLIGGSTGSGKSFFQHSLIQGVQKRGSANLVLMDPKRVEFGAYEGLDYIYGKVCFSREDIADKLAWLNEEMAARFLRLKSLGLRDIYSGRSGVRPLVVVIDEVQDILLDKRSSGLISSLAAQGRAAGIHLILCTQHPSTEVITSRIKSNFPARVAFKTANSIYSRVLLDQGGAEFLMGQGDGLFKNDSNLIRFKAPVPVIPKLRRGFWSRLWSSDETY